MGPETVEPSSATPTAGDRLRAASPAEVLARAGARLAALAEPEEIVAETARAVCELSGFSSVALALTDGPAGPLAVRHARGPFGAVLAAMGRAELATLAAWVDAGTSGCAVPAAGLAVVRDEVPHVAEARGLVVVPLVAAGERLGVLVLADAEARLLAKGEVEFLELLAIQAAAGLRTAAALAELRRRAARDPLTGLGHHGTFRAALPILRRECPPGDAPALLLADVDDFKGINDRLGHAAGDTVLRRVAAYLDMTAPSGVTAYRIGGDEFAVLACLGGETEALALGERLSEAVRTGVGVTLSVGVAFARCDEDDAALRDRADAALYAVKRAGRDGVALG